jgi:hypothetical protein
VTRGDPMKYKIVYYVETTKRGFLGFPKKVREKRVVYVDGKTYRKLQRDFNNRPYSIEEMFLYDMIFDED